MKPFYFLLLVSGLFLGSCNNNSNNNANQPDAQTYQQNGSEQKHHEHGNGSGNGGGGNGESKAKKDLQEQIKTAEADLQKNQQQHDAQATALTSATEELNRLQNNHALKMGGGDRTAQIKAQSDKVDAIKKDMDNLAEAATHIETNISQLKAQLAKTE